MSAPDTDHGVFVNLWAYTAELPLRDAQSVFLPVFKLWNNVTKSVLKLYTWYVFFKHLQQNPEIGWYLCVTKEISMGPYCNIFCEFRTCELLKLECSALKTKRWVYHLVVASTISKTKLKYEVI